MQSIRLKEKTFWYHLRQYLREYGQISNIHGVHYLTEKRTRPEKYFWLVILLLSFSGCVLMFYKIWEKYENNPIVMSFATKEIPIYEIPFPAVTICPESKCANEKFNYSDVFNRLYENQSVTDEELRIFSYMRMMCQADQYKYLGAHNKTVDEYFLSVIDEVKPNFTIECTFLEEINCEDRFIPIMTDQGVCYSFNILDREMIFRENIVHHKNYHRANYSFDDFNGDAGFVKSAGVVTYPLRALMSGADNSLEVYFEINTITDVDYACNSFIQGFSVMVHNPMDIPRPSKYYFRVPFDKEVLVAVQPELILTSKEVQNFDVEKRNCYLKSERFLHYFKIYTQSNCVLECFTNHTLKNCGCVEFFMPRKNTTSICGYQSDDCVSKAYNEMIVEDLTRKFSGLGKSCDCKPLCTDLRYTVETSQSVFIGKEFYKIREKDNFDFTNKKWSYLNIYIKSDQFTAMERKGLYGISDLISNFGGLLGLFTGFSLISLFEILYFLTLRIYYNTRLHAHWSGSAV